MQEQSSITVSSMTERIHSARKRRPINFSWSAYLFLLPTFLAIGTFSYFPAIRALVGAFTTWNGFTPPVWVGLSNFVQALQDPTLRQAAVHIFWWALIGIPIGLVPPFIAAELIFHLRSSTLQYLYRSAFVVSMVVPGVVSLLIWQFIYSPTGLLNVLFKDLGFPGLRHAWLANPHLALGSLILMGFPWVGAFALLIYYAGLNAIPQDIFDAAAVDGCEGIRRIWAIDFRLVLPQFKLLLVLSVLGVSQNLLTPLLMTDGGPGTATVTPGLYMFQAAINNDQYGYSMAIAFLLFVVVMTLTVVNMKYFQTND